LNVTFRASAFARLAGSLVFWGHHAVGAENSTSDYAGDIACREAWDILLRDPTAQLIDVRTRAEWTFVGVPDVAALKRRLLAVEWQSYPSMEQNPQFVAETAARLAEAGAGKDSPLLFLCRSGARSRAAARAMAQAGYGRAYNISGGFEGDPDGEGHRGVSNGWKASGLPWRQS
jgi:rhodanese-related sulfurtransferase